MARIRTIPKAARLTENSSRLPRLIKTVLPKQIQAAVRMILRKRITMAAAITVQQSRLPIQRLSLPRHLQNQRKGTLS